MFCEKCGIELEENARFCYSCGTSVNQGDVSQASASQICALPRNKKSVYLIGGTLAILILVISFFLFSDKRIFILESDTKTDALLETNTQQIMEENESPVRTDIPEGVILESGNHIGEYHQVFQNQGMLEISCEYDGLSTMACVRVLPYEDACYHGYDMHKVEIAYDNKGVSCITKLMYIPYEYENRSQANLSLMNLYGNNFVLFDDYFVLIKRQSHLDNPAVLRIYLGLPDGQEVSPLQPQDVMAEYLADGYIQR